MTKGFFITGTDTGVGKTVVAGAVIKVLNYLGLTTGAMKPVETGCRREGGVLVPDDGLFLRDMAGIDEPVKFITPFCFENPLAPMVAAEREAAEVDVQEIQDVFLRMREKYDAMVVEGVGGLMVPLSQDYYVTELAAALGLPLLIVAGPGLGTINHTMLTLSHARSAGLRIAGIIINYCRPPENSLAEKTNPGILARIAGVPVIGIFPYLEKINGDVIRTTGVTNLDLTVLKRYL